MAGRVETYTHSDSVTPNKGSVTIRVKCTTDFAARTAEFIAFCKKAAMLSYAARADFWHDVTNFYPEFETERQDLEKVLKEKVVVDAITRTILE